MYKCTKSKKERNPTELKSNIHMKTVFKTSKQTHTLLVSKHKTNTNNAISYIKNILYIKHKEDADKTHAGTD